MASKNCDGELKFPLPSPEHKRLIESAEIKIPVHCEVENNCTTDFDADTYDELYLDLLTGHTGG